MEGPRISVVTPSLNQGSFIRCAIESVLAQTYPNVEYIIVDGLSDDETPGILDGYMAEVSRIIREADAGQSDAINKGWRAATGEVLAWLNADDAYEPNTLFSVARFFNSHPQCDIVYGECRWIEANGETLRERSAQPFDPEALLLWDFIPSGSTFVRRRVLERIGYLDTCLRFLLDWEYWIRACGQCEFAFVDEVWSLFRVHAAARTWSDPIGKGNETKLLADRLWAGRSDGYWTRPTLRRAVGSMYRSSSMYAAQGGDYRAARRRLAASILRNPAGLGRSHFRPLLLALFGKHGDRVHGFLAGAARRYRVIDRHESTDPGHELVLSLDSRTGDGRRSGREAQP